MSVQENDVPTDVEERNSGQASRVATDSVHGRFRPSRVHCDVCDVDIIGTPIAIQAHFNDSHMALQECCYCKGKVFTYRRVFQDNDFNDTSSKEFVYHTCRNSRN